MKVLVVLGTRPEVIKLAPVIAALQHRVEGVCAGFVTLSGQDTQIIEEAVDDWLADELRRDVMRAKVNPYGDARDSARILAALLNEPSEDFHG